MRKLTQIIIHCSATPDATAKNFNARDVKMWHLERGFSDVGYHYIIDRTGRLDEGRPLRTAGAHARGHNSDSIGVCWIGMENPTMRQYRALVSVVQKLMEKHDIPLSEVRGHKELPGVNKSCPGISMDRFRQDVAGPLGSNVKQEIRDMIITYIKDVLK